MDFFYPPELPITSHRAALIETLKNNRVTIVAGETGSGKTTQLPKICLEAFPELKGMIGCTQPRRVAALSLSNRLQEELGDQGSIVGCKIRFFDRTDEQTKIKFMTDGILLAESRNDPQLKKYSIIIIDEAHERSLNIDFLIGYIKQLLTIRKDLRVVLTSATIDTALFSDHFDKAPVIHIEGKTYPVEIKYTPPSDEESSFVDQCIEVADYIVHHYPAGDILIFLPTERDILSCCKVLEGRINHCLTIPLYGRLQHTEQQAIFKSHHRTKIVVATNVAETSITVPGIKYVIDSGRARISKYHPKSRIYKLPIDFISKASSNQRAGRCGRVAPGICFRLYSEQDFNKREEFSTPEIKRSNLASVILQMIYLKLGDPYQFPFLEPPAHGTIKEGYRTLRELGGITGANQLTSTGQLMATLPIDPVIARIVIEANNNNCLREILIISSGLAIQDPRITPADKKEHYIQAHQAFFHPQSEFLVLLNIWQAVHPDQKRLSISRLRKFCKSHFLSFQRMREWLDLHDQLKSILKRKIEINLNSQSADYDTIHKTILTGMFSQCAKRIKKNLYQGSGNREIMIFPGSSQYNRAGDWILSGSFLETSRLFALSVASIEPSWIETVAKDYCTYSWQNPRWHKKNGCVMADESVHLYGLQIIAKRVVNYPRAAKKNITKARPIFIRSGLVEAQTKKQYNFLTHNLSLIEQWRGAEEKLRKRNIVVDEETIYSFYDQRLPDQVCDIKSLNRYLKKHSDNDLFLTEEDVLLRTPDDHELIDFPSTLDTPTAPIRLEYHFEPGSDRDGVTAFIPVHIIQHLSGEIFDWLVPGLLEEKTTFLLKSLPKTQRKKLIPISNTVARVLDQLVNYQGNYYQKLSSAVALLFNVSINRSQWSIRDLPTHLKMRYCLTDHSSEIIMCTRTFSDLRRAPQERVSTDHLKPSTADQQLLDSLKDAIFNRWEFDHLPQVIPLYSAANQVGGKLFFSIVPQSNKQGVSVHYCKSLEAASHNNEKGILYLTKLHNLGVYKQFKKETKLALSGPSGQWLLDRFGPHAQLTDTLFYLLVKEMTVQELRNITSQEQFSATLKDIKERGFYKTAQHTIELLCSVLIKRTEVEQSIIKLSAQSPTKGQKNSDIYTRMDQELTLIFPESFPISLSKDYLNDLLRYLKSLVIRLNRAHANPLKDQKKHDSIDHHLQQLDSLVKMNHLSAECAQYAQNYQQMIQEMKISLFSPEIKTRIPVSEKKLAQYWLEIKANCY